MSLLSAPSSPPTNPPTRLRTRYVAPATHPGYQTVMGGEPLAEGVRASGWIRGDLVPGVLVDEETEVGEFPSLLSIVLSLGV